LQAVRKEMQETAAEFDLRCQNIAARFGRLKCKSFNDQEFLQHITELCANRKWRKVTPSQLVNNAAALRDIADYLDSDGSLKTS